MRVEPVTRCAPGGDASITVTVHNGTDKDILSWQLRWEGNAMFRKGMRSGPKVAATESISVVINLQGVVGAQLRAIERKLAFTAEIEFEGEQGKQSVAVSAALRAGYFAKGLLAMRPLREERPFRIVLIGPPGCGKSSFANTIKTALEATGHVLHPAVTLSKSNHITRGVHCIPVFGEDNSVKAIVLVDTRGMEEGSGWRENDLRLVVEGMYREGRDLPDVPLEELRSEAAQCQDTAHLRRADSVICCVPYTYFGEEDETLESKRTYLQRMLMSVRHLNPFVVVTRADEDNTVLRPDGDAWSADTGSVKVALDEVRSNAAQMFCVPADRVFVSINYTGNTTFFGVDKMTLLTLEAVLEWCRTAEQQRLDLHQMQQGYLAAAVPQHTTPLLLFMEDETVIDVDRLTVEDITAMQAEMGISDLRLAECDADGVLVQPIRWVEHGPIETHVRAVRRSGEG